MTREERREVSLTVLLVLQVCYIFLAEPAAAIDLVSGFWFTQMLVAVMTAAVIIVAHNRVTAIVAFMAQLSACAAVAMRQRWPSPITDGIGACTAFTAVITMSWIVARHVYAPGEMTAHRLRGAFVLYFNIALGFGAVYQLIEEVVPGSFRGIEPSGAQQGVVADLLYFSLITLSSTGFGDILPIHRIARSITGLEAIAGQLYIATVLGRLITLDRSVTRATKTADQ
jgi:hypothetical protein